MASRSFLGLPTPNDHLALAPERAVGGEALAVAAVRLHAQSRIDCRLKKVRGKNSCERSPQQAPEDQWKRQDSGRYGCDLFPRRRARAGPGRDGSGLALPVPETCTFHSEARGERIALTGHGRRLQRPLLERDGEHPRECNPDAEHQGANQGTTHTHLLDPFPPARLLARCDRGGLQLRLLCVNRQSDMHKCIYGRQKFPARRRCRRSI